MIPSTTERVPKHTMECVNDQIRKRTEENIRAAAAGGSQAIDRRIAELDREWDIERTLETNAAVASLLGVFLARRSAANGSLFPRSSAASCFSTRSRAGARRCRSFAAWASARRRRSTASVTR